MRRDDDWIEIPIIAAFGLGLTCLALYPGFLNADSQWQLSQAQMGIYNNEHPPFMAFVWRYLNFILPGGAGLFVFHAAIFWLGFALFVHETLAGGKQSFFACAAALCFLPLSASFAVLVKDGGFTYALVLSSAALLRAERDNSLPWVAISMASLFYAVALRHNGLAAALPLTLWAGRIVAPRWRGLTRQIGENKSAVVLGLLLLAYQGAATNLVNRLLTTDEAHPAQMMLTWDLTGISVLAGRNYLPESLSWDNRPLTMSELKKVYSPESNFFILWGSQPDPRPGWVFNDEDYEALRQAWVTAVWEQPAAYLSHRLSAFIRFLGFRTASRPYWFPPSRTVSEQGSWNRAAKVSLIRFVERYPGAFIFKAWFYMLVAAGCLGFGAWRRTTSPAFWSIGASGLLYELSYLFVSTAGDFRYSWWLLCVSLMLPPLLVARRIT